MNKRNILTLQLTASIAIASLLIIFSTIYFFNKLSIFLAQNDTIINRSQDKLSLANNLGTTLYQITQIKVELINSNDATLFKELKDLRVQEIRLLRELEGMINQRDQISFAVLKEVLANALDLSNFEVAGSALNRQTTISHLVNEHQKIQDALISFIEAVIKERSNDLEHNKAKIAQSKHVTIALVVISLLIIIYTFYKVIQIMKYLRNSRRELRTLNEEFLSVQQGIEDSNWILQTNSILSERISNVDDEKTICKIALDIFNTYLPTKAATIYIRKADSPEFNLLAQSGIVTKDVVSGFLSGEGFLGKIVEDKKIISIAIDDYNHLKSASSLIEKLPVQIFIAPIVIDDDCLGVIEIALDINDTEIKKISDFFTRMNRTIGTRLKFGQSHLLVGKLLEETQKQTEELEAQQEELRITNEELIHKTHLLESSEEELRVQQEELTQINIELNHKAGELERRNGELNDAQRTVELKIAEVEQASRYKSEFMANMSHELRTPLNSILILAKLLQDNKGKNLTDEQVKFAGVIKTAGSDLLELINELLDLAKIEAGKIDLNLERIDIAAFHLSVEELFKAIAADKGINFITKVADDVPSFFVSDEYRIQQVLKNFLSNSFKFTDKDGTVCFEIKKVNQNLHFVVRDSGKGISQEKQQLIFEAFRQEDGSTSRKYGGTGLGLSISKEIASLLGGRITLESEVGEGSTFILIIPCEESLENISPATSRSTTIPVSKDTSTVSSTLLKESPTGDVLNKSSRTILIVEDDVNFADILKGFAENYGFSVLLAHDGAKGIHLAIEHKPDAIILDVMLPISDGWKVLDILKENESTRHIPIHMMSAASFNKKEFLEKGAIGFMQKPVSEETIQRTFETININLAKSVKKILLIEDQELQSDFIRNSFIEQNINVLQAFSLASAWNMLRSEQNIDCIILDMNLPDGNGISFIEKIKGNPELIDIPIIINTAYELPKEQYEKVVSYAKATILKSEKSSDRLIDEVNLFLNKINDDSYQPIRNIQKVENLSSQNVLQGKRVLIADDDMRNVFALSNALQAFDMQIDIANNGLEAVNMVNEKGEEIDIILMDIMMPEMDGYEAIQTIRENPKYKKLPILAVTAKAMKGDKEKSIQIGASDYISKPIDIDKLISLMQIWLS